MAKGNGNTRASLAKKTKKFLEKAMGVENKKLSNAQLAEMAADRIIKNLNK